MGMSVGGPGGGPKADINMTPMIDVLLVLIIIFMVITPLTPKGLEALVPQPPPPNQKPNLSDQRTVVIVVDDKHNYSINNEPQPEDKLGDRLQLVVEDDAQSPVEVKPRDGVGLSNVRERLAAAFDGKASCSAGPRDGGGFRVELQIPLQFDA